MTNFFAEFVLLLSWFLGISTVLLVTFLMFEFVQHRKFYRTDHWSEEALLEERVASGTLPSPAHVITMERAVPEKRSVRFTKRSPVRKIPFMHKVVR